MKTFFLFLIAVNCISCFKEDERVLPYPGEISTINEPLQFFQSYFDLESARVVSTNRADEWQLAFESSPEGWHIMVNSGADWFIYNTGSQLPQNLSMPVTLHGLYDNQQAWPDSTAVGNWTVHNNIYHLARYSNGTFRQLKQLRFLNYTDSSYIFSWADSLGNDTVLIRKDPETSFSYYSFEERTQVYPEPPRDHYDIIFTSYYDMPTLFGQTIPYKVAGALINVWQTKAAIDSAHNYSEINMEIAGDLVLTSRRDIPGYNWKNVVVDITGGGSATYDVKTHYNYIFRTSDGNYYKLRFLSYTLDGLSGYPRFEFSRLQ